MNIKFSTFKDASENAKHLAKEGRKVSVTKEDDCWIVKISKEENSIYESSSLWVGKFLKTGHIVVFDDSFKIDGIENIYGYDSNISSMRQFKLYQKEMAQPATEYEKKQAIKKYLNWKKMNEASFIKKELSVIQEKEEKAIKKHKEYLEKIGKEYIGIEFKPSKLHRATHCYACKEPLDSDFHIECKACKWLICGCGACGCGYEK